MPAGPFEQVEAGSSAEPPTGSFDRWTVEQVLAVAPSSGAVAVAEAFTDAARWSATGADDRTVWGRCQGSTREPYDVAVDHVGVGWRCSCPSRVRPCKHALALLLRWVRGEIHAGTAPPSVASWAARRVAAEAGSTDAPGAPAPSVADTGRDPASAGPGSGGDRPTPSDPVPSPPSPSPSPPDPAERERGRDERMARMRAGLVELQRWLEDRMRTGLTDPSLARYATWDDLAARLVDARVGGLANRVRRMAGLVGAGTDWHERVLVELGMLHLLVRGALAVGGAPLAHDLAGAPDGDLADAIAVASGWQVRQADVLAGVPDTDEWVVAGRSDTREDRIEVRRTWLWGRRSKRWAMVLSFAAYGQGLDDSLRVGEVCAADLFRYPGGGLRALVGPASVSTPALPESEPAAEPAEEVAEPSGPALPDPLDVAGACRAVGEVIAAEPWIERHAVTLRAAPTVADGRWVLTDDTGSMPLIGDQTALATLVAASLGSMVPITVEWTPYGVLPLTVHRPDRAVDVGPRADPSFVGS